MLTFYHLTTEDNVNSILKDGLIPHIGERSQSVGELKKHVYLCNEEDVPFWSAVLSLPVVLKVNMKEAEINTNNVYHYSYYSETLIDTPISAERICRSNISTELTAEQKKDLSLSYLGMISYTCVKFATYITYISDTEKESMARHNLNNAEVLIKSLQFTLPNLDFSGVTAKMLRDCLHEMGNSGLYTLCDRYEPDCKEGEKNLRLYELLDKHPLATEDTKMLYKWIKKTFPKRLRVNTGGWTG